MNEKEEKFTPLIKMINDLIEKKANKNFKKFDITFSQIRIIMLLYNTERIYSLKELEKWFNVSQQTMAGIIKRLELKKIIETVDDPTDRRVKKIKLSEGGKLLSEKTANKVFETEEWISSGLTEEEKETFYNLLKKIYSNIN